MTEGNTQLTLHDESIETIIEVLETLGEGITYKPTTDHAEELGAIGETIRAQKPVHPNYAPEAIIALCGLPGAGKSYVADKLSEVYDCPSYTMGDAIRREFMIQECDEDPDDYDGVMVSSDALGDFAAEKRAEDPEQIPEWTVEMVRGSHPEVAIVDGVRSTTDYEVLSDYFDIWLIQVNAPFYTRLERLQKRGREGEADFDSVDLAERDQNEYENLGYRGLLEMDPPMIELENSSGEVTLRERLASIVNEELPFKQKDVEPLLPPVGQNPTGVIHD